MPLELNVFWQLNFKQVEIIEKAIMVKQCQFCGATFKVFCIGGGGFSGACLEPIICPHCSKTVDEERTTGTYQTELLKAPESQLARYLGISDEEWERMGVDLVADTGQSGDMTYSYWFTVPEDVAQPVMNKTGWRPGCIVTGIPIWVVEHE
jgi:hypothetical protein